MTFKAIVVAVLLVAGVGLQLLSCLGLLAMRDTLARLHYVAPGGFGVALIAAAIVVQESFSIVGDKAIVSAVVVLLAGPVLVHVTARTTRIRRAGEWPVHAGEKVERLPR